MEYIITIVIGVITAMLTFILQSVMKENRKLNKEREERDKARDSALENGVRQVLSVFMEEIYDRYADSETIPRRVYDRWMKMHCAYKGLNGNGTFDHMKKELEEKHIINT
jgi:hypothetical protein